jgi:GAF domain-containing protein
LRRSIGRDLRPTIRNGQETGKFQIAHETALLGIAGHAATSIDNARLFQAAERELAERRRAESKSKATITMLFDLPLS